MRLHVDVVSDVICPWCFIGKRRLEKALRALPGDVEVEVAWHPFELNPEMPRAGMERSTYRAAKFGSAEASRAIDARLIAAGAHDGIAFAFDRIRRTPNTFDPHRLIWFAGREGAQDTLVESLFQKYFVEGVDIAPQAALIDIAVASGLARDRVVHCLEDGESVTAVRQAEAEAWRDGIHAVPHFIIDGKYAISGAQSAPVLTAAFEQILALRRAPDAPAVIHTDRSAERR